MAKIEFSSRANNNPAENLLTPIILLLGIVFAVFGIKLKWFRHRLTFNSSASNTPISNSENTNQVFGVYKRNEIDERDFRAQVPNEVTPSYTASSNHNGESSSSHYKAVKVNNEIKLIPPAPSYTPPTIHQGNIKITEVRADFNNNAKEKKATTKDTKSPKYIRIRKDEINKNLIAPPKAKTPSPQPVQHITPTVHVAQANNNKPKAAAPILAPQPPVNIAPPTQILVAAPPVVKQEVKIATPIVKHLPSSILKQSVKIQAPEIEKPPPPYAPPSVIEIENTTITDKLNSMPTTYIQLSDFDSTESNDIPPPTIRSVQYHDEYELPHDDFAYNDTITIITPASASQNRNMTYNDKIEIVSASNDDDLFQKMKPTPRTTGINYLEYQSIHNNNRNNVADGNSESKFNNDVDDNDYELAPIEFLSKTTTTTTTTAKPNTAAINTATVKNEMTQNHIKTQSTTMMMMIPTTNTTNNKKDERKMVVDANDEDDDGDDDADDDNMWDLVAKHRKNVGRKVERDPVVNVNSKLKQNQRVMLNSIVANDKPKTLRELHSQNRENNRNIAQQAVPAKPTSKSSNIVTFGELDDEADA